jgi:hypothetical protein
MIILGEITLNLSELLVALYFLNGLIMEILFVVKENHQLVFFSLNE